MTRRLSMGSTPSLSEVPLGGSTFLAPSDDENGIAVGNGSLGYTKIMPDTGDIDCVGDLDMTGDIIMPSGGTVDGRVVDRLVEPAFMFAPMSTDTATNGTTEVDIPWASLYGNNWAITGSGVNCVCQEEGMYMIYVTLGSNFNGNNQIITLKFYERTPPSVIWNNKSAGTRKTHTSSALAVQVNLVGFCIFLAAGDEVKITGSFSAADAGSNFVALNSNFSVFKVSNYS